MFDAVFIQIIADWLVYPIVLIAGAAMLFLVRRKRYQSYVRAFMAGMVALVLAKFASLLYQGQRPFELMGAEPGASYLDNPGFPSDHVLFVFVITLVVWASTKNKPLAWTLLGLSCLVGVGRMLALVHTPIDVLGGVACAFLAAYIMYGRSLFRVQ